MEAKAANGTVPVCSIGFHRLPDDRSRKVHLIHAPPQSIAWLSFCSFCFLLKPDYCTLEDGGGGGGVLAASHVA